MPQKYLVLDYETRSEIDLKAVGAYEYSRHPSTQIICAAWRIGTREELPTAPIKTWAFHAPDTISQTHLRLTLQNPHLKIVAHNAFFEQVITVSVLQEFNSVPIPIDRWVCTASMARAMALPGNLEGACAALKLPVQKDMEGRKLILKYCRPRKATKDNKAKWHADPKDFDRLVEYCKKDVEAETALFLALPELNPTERKVWLLDQKMNWKGFRADRPTIQKIQGMIAEESKTLNAELKELTFGVVPTANQRANLLEWVNIEGAGLENLQAKTIRDRLKAPGLTDTARRILQIRQDVSKTSTAKFAAFEMRSRSDGRCRDNLVYHTASTGRWGGAGVQPQNFPRGTIRGAVKAAEICATEDLEMIRLLYGNPMSVFASVLRPMIQASEGKTFFCADYAAIEARVLFWVANHENGLEDFRDGRPMYEEMALAIFGHKTLEQVTKEEREVGKRAILGLGYQMGAEKFMETCDLHADMKIEEDVAKAAVKAYRTIHSPVPELWAVIDKAAQYAVKSGKRVTVNHTTWFVENNFLLCELPSGRRLAYYGPEVRRERNLWREKKIRKLGEQIADKATKLEARESKRAEVVGLRAQINREPVLWKSTLYHWGVNSLTKKWECAGTYGGKLVENVVQAIARDLMAESMLRIDEAGFDVILSVHDEILAEGLETQSLENFNALMAETPAWAEGLPVKVAGWSGLRYRK